MKSAAVEILHQGKKRKVQKQEYSKLRSYNKIKGTKIQSSASSRLQSSENNKQQQQSSVDQLLDIIESLKQSNMTMEEQNKFMAKQIKRLQKIDRIVFKKCANISQIIESQPTSRTNNGQNLSSSRTINEKDLQTMLEVKLSLDVIQLESVLDQKKQLQKKLMENKRKKHEQQILNKFEESKTQFLSILSTEPYFQGILQQLSSQNTKIKQKLQSIHSKLKSSSKTKQNTIQILSQLEYQLKQLKQQAEQRAKKHRKNSCEYIQVQNGEVKNQQDIKNQLSQILSKRKRYGEELQQFLEQRMLQKIVLVNQIEKLEIQCKRVAPNLYNKNFSSFNRINTQMNLNMSTKRTGMVNHRQSLQLS